MINVKVSLKCCRWYTSFLPYLTPINVSFFLLVRDQMMVIVIVITITIIIIVIIIIILIMIKTC